MYVTYVKCYLIRFGSCSLTNSVVMLVIVDESVSSLRFFESVFLISNDSNDLN